MLDKSTPLLNNIMNKFYNTISLLGKTQPAPQKSAQQQLQQQLQQQTVPQGTVEKK